jgi:hypothetical protein
MFTLTINTGNEAFFQDAGEEISRILRLVAKQASDGYYSGRINDSNGNHVGDWANA